MELSTGKSKLIEFSIIFGLAGIPILFCLLGLFCILISKIHCDCSLFVEVIKRILARFREKKDVQQSEPPICSDIIIKL